jgi:hypothetical protein
MDSHRTAPFRVTPNGSLEAAERGDIDVAGMKNAPPPAQLATQRRGAEIAASLVIVVGSGQERGRDQFQGAGKLVAGLAFLHRRIPSALNAHGELLGRLVVRLKLERSIAGVRLCSGACVANVNQWSVEFVRPICIWDLSAVEKIGEGLFELHLHVCRMGESLMIYGRRDGNKSRAVSAG